MNVFLGTPEFDTWLKALRDPIGKARVIARIRSAEAGNFGDCGPVGNGISEMRVHVGPGYRLYYSRKGDVLSCSCAAGTNRLKPKTLSWPKSFLRSWRIEHETHRCL